MNLFDLFIKIVFDDQASDKISKISKNIGTGLKTAAKIGTAAVTAAATGIGALTTAAIKNYAEYEQLVGGVDTLFKESSQKLQQYANEAYMTSGMSANDYMSNATAFSAALISSLGGNTEEAVEYVNRAMVSMSDNANKMGTSLDSIVQTYQSLSRGQFQLLDNLKLGYGGTKEELQRLIKDAASYTEIQEQMGITVDKTSMSFDNIVNAIAVVQGHFNIAGATAAEASTTIEGSVNSMKAAWENLITGLGSENADLEQLISNFVKTVVGDENGEGGVLANILPRIEVVLGGAASLVEEMIPIIMEKIPSIITDTLPKILNAAISIIEGLVKGISENQDQIASSAIEIVDTLINSIFSLTPEILTTALELVITLAQGLSENVGELLPAAADLIWEIVNTLTSKENLDLLIQTALLLVEEISVGLVDAVPQLINAATELLHNIYLTLLEPENLAMLVEAAVILVVTLTEAVVASIPVFIEAWVEMIDDLIVQLEDTDWKSVGSDFVDNIWQGIKDGWSDMTEWVSDSWNGMVDIVSDFRSSVKRKANGSNAGGLDYVPYNNYLANLHKGERILTKKENEEYSLLRSRASVSVVQNIYSQAQTAADLMEQAVYQQERAVFIGA